MWGYKTPKIRVPHPVKLRRIIEKTNTSFSYIYLYLSYKIYCNMVLHTYGTFAGYVCGHIINLLGEIKQGIFDGRNSSSKRKSCHFFSKKLNTRTHNHTAVYQYSANNIIIRYNAYLSIICCGYATTTIGKPLTNKIKKLATLNCCCCCWRSLAFCKLFEKPHVCQFVQKTPEFLFYFIFASLMTKHRQSFSSASAFLPMVFCKIQQITNYL